MTVVGEDAQDIGESGLQRAKEWLELTTRVNDSWTRHDRALRELLEFKWPGLPPESRAASFSFDLGGRFRGDSLDNQAFLAEVKKYKNESDLPAHFRDFLAKCYVALGTHPGRCDHFLWISWAPFQASKWDQHASTDNVKASVLHSANRKRTLGVDDENEAADKLSADLLVGVATKVWLVTLSDKQEQLVLTNDHYLEVARLILAEGRL